MDKKVKIGAAIGVVVLIAAIFCWYHFNVSAKSPEYAIQNVEQALAKHEKENVERFVNLDSLLDSAYDDIVAGLIDAEKNMSEDSKEVVKNFSAGLKVPMVLGLRAATDSFVATGNFDGLSGMTDILQKIGLDKIEYRGTEKIETVEGNESEAVAHIKIFQPEFNKEFILETLLQRDSDGNWKVVRFRNFRDFVKEINVVRRENLQKYLDASDEIISKHEKIVRDAEQKAGILSAGNLSSESFRADLKNLMTDIKKDWEDRKRELFELPVPKEAETLQGLRIQICDLYVGYVDDYTRWMDDKKSATLKSADEKKHRAQNLETEAAVLAKKLAD